MNEELNIRNIKASIVDYQMSNLYSVRNACNYAGFDSKITSDSKDFEYADVVILPGVGAFPKAMENLKNLDLINPIKDFIASGKTFIGICLGFQLLFSGSEEFGSMEGFDLIKGLVKKIDNTTNNIKVPHIGWNRIYPLNKDLSTWHGTILNDITSGEYMYFIHSYFAEPESEEHILSITNYNGFSFCSGIKKNNIYGLQFHPEKSAQKGIQIYNNIYNQIKNNYVKA